MNKLASIYYFKRALAQDTFSSEWDWQINQLYGNIRNQWQREFQNFNETYDTRYYENGYEESVFHSLSG